MGTEVTKRKAPEDEELKAWRMYALTKGQDFSQCRAAWQHRGGGETMVALRSGRHQAAITDSLSAPQPGGSGRAVPPASSSWREVPPKRSPAGVG